MAFANNKQKLDTNIPIGFNQTFPNQPWENNILNQPLINVPTGRYHNVIKYYLYQPGFLKSQIKTAIKHWNQLGVLRLIPTKNKTHANFAISFNNDPHSQENGDANAVTVYQNKTVPNQNYGRLTHVHIYLEAIVELLISRQLQINIIEHEIGHALGFAHDQRISIDENNYKNYTDSIMHNDDALTHNKNETKTIPLGNMEAYNLRIHYPMIIKKEQ